jgi:SecY interacting protein Syd
MGEVAESLLALLERGSALPVEHDPEWPSPCEILPPDPDGMVRWRPIKMEPPADFVGVHLHSDIQEFYGSWWGGHVEGRHSGEVVFLDVAWNKDDLAQIRQTLDTHVAAGEPVFVAGTDSDWYFGVDNVSGAVMLCESGRPPLRQIAPSLAAFLAGVQ